MLRSRLEISHTLKMGALVAAACVAAGGGAAYVVSKLHSGSASAATRTSGLKTGVIGRGGGFGFAPPGDSDRRGRFFGLGRGAGLAAAAGYLGTSTSDLFAKLQSGRTLAQIAQATSGKSVAGLIAAMTSAQKSELAAAVKDGRLTQAEAETLGARLTDHVTAMVNGRFGFHRRFGPTPL